MRLPFDPVDAYLTATSEGTVRLGAGEVAERVGPMPGGRRISTRAIARYRDDGLNVWRADAVAVALGLDPVMLWGQAWSDLVDDAVGRWMERHPKDALT
jgi:hypothetical protein